MQQQKFIYNAKKKLYCKFAWSDNQKMERKYPRKLSAGANNTVIVLNENEVAKLFSGDTRSDLGSEAEKMKYNYLENISWIVKKYIAIQKFQITLWQD